MGLVSSKLLNSMGYHRVYIHTNFCDIKETKNDIKSEYRASTLKNGVKISALVDPKFESL